MDTPLPALVDYEATEALLRFVAVNPRAIPKLLEEIKAGEFNSVYRIARDIGYIVFKDPPSMLTDDQLEVCAVQAKLLGENELAKLCSNHIWLRQKFKVNHSTRILETQLRQKGLLREQAG